MQGLTLKASQAYLDPELITAFHGHQLPMWRPRFRSSKSQKITRKTSHLTLLRKKSTFLRLKRRSTTSSKRKLEHLCVKQHWWRKRKGVPQRLNWKSMKNWLTWIRSVLRCLQTRSLSSTLHNIWLTSKRCWTKSPKRLGHSPKSQRSKRTNSFRLWRRQNLLWFCFACCQSWNWRRRTRTTSASTWLERSLRCWWSRLTEWWSELEVALLRLRSTSSK